MSAKVAQTDKQLREIANGKPDAWVGEEANPEEDAPIVQKRTSLFSTMESVKQRLRASVKRDEEKGTYDVKNFYWDEHETGLKWYFQHIAKHQYFENATLSVISFNALWIAIDTDWDKANILTMKQPLFQAMEHMFCAYFTWEWIIRFGAFKRKCDGRKDAWFVFDSLLVFMMVLETWVMTIIGGELPFPTAILRLFRLLRLSRLVRMLKSFPQLLILVKGMMQAMKSVSYVMCLQAIITYVFAILFSQLYADDPVLRTYFANVPLAMYSLFIHATFMDDLQPFLDDIRATDNPIGPWVALPFMGVFICLAAFTVMNMLIGVLCEVVSQVAEEEKETIKVERVEHQMKKVMTSLDKDANGKMTRQEFEGIMTNKEALKALESVDVDPEGIVDFADLFFNDDQDQPKALEFEEFMEMIMDLRNTNNATVKTVLDVWSKIKKKMTHNFDELSEVKTQVRDLKAEMTTKADEIIKQLDMAKEVLRIQ